MGDEWFRAYKTAVNTAKQLKLEVWIYDEDGWPSGFAGGLVPRLGEKHWIKELCFSESCEGNRSDILAAWRFENSDYVSIPIENAENGDLICRYESDRNYVDLLSADTVKEFIGVTHERYKKELGSFFGTVIKGVFTDEPQIKSMPWSYCLENKWKERYNSDLRAMLYMLVKETGDWKRFRTRFRLLVNDVFSESFTGQISEWCEKNGLIMTGHFAGEDGLCTQVAQNCGVMRHYTKMQMPGIDHLGNRITSPVLSKQASSIASQFGKTDVLSETFGCSGWGVTFKRLAWIWGRQSVLGITKPCYHLSAYSIAGRRKRDYPAFFSYQEPWWNEFKAFNGWFDGINAYMKQGKRLTETLVISPIQSVMAFYTDDKTRDAMSFFSAQYRLLIENLLDLQLDCELTDEKILEENAVVCGDSLNIGASSYKTVFVSQCYSISSHTVALLREFAKNGGRVFFVGERPGYTDFERKSIGDFCTVQNRRDAIEKLISYAAIKRPVRVVDKYNNKSVSGVCVHIRKADDKAAVHIWTSESFGSENCALLIESEEPGYLFAAEKDFLNGNDIPLRVKKTGFGFLADITLKPETNTVIEISQSGNPQRDKCCKSVIVTEIDDAVITLGEPNVLTLDSAEISVNGGDFTKDGVLLYQLDKIYALREKIPRDKPMNIDTRFSFYCNKDYTPDDICLAIEDRDVKGITMNGRNVFYGKKGWWIDRCISLYDISDFIISGQNYITVSYIIPPGAESVSITNGFETERNRFCYPVEPESIYLRGSFDVLPLGDLKSFGYYFHTSARKFELKKSTEKNMGDLTGQGMWFYRGNADYTFTVGRKYGDSQLRLKFKITNATAAVCETAHGKITVTDFSSGADISEITMVGNNTVKVTLLGSNRNVFGPHHHICGENFFVGPDTFKGEKGFEDFVSPQITDKSTKKDGYSFIPFGSEGYEIIEYCRRDE